MILTSCLLRPYLYLDGRSDAPINRCLFAMARKTTTRAKSATVSKRSSSAGSGSAPSKKKKTARRKTTSHSAAGAKGKSLVIVESPAKAKTINRYLGPEYTVRASVGHIRDLPAKAKKGDKRPVPGVDLEHDFAPEYEVMPGKKKVVDDLRKAARQATDIWFATDLDREGEAIAWHLAQLLKVDPASAKRVVFNAITKTEIARAFLQPHTIDQNKVNAQQARRVLDRIVGYLVSPLLWKKVARGLSAGRVQSVAVRLIVAREREIRSFIPDEYWSMQARFAANIELAPALVDQWRQFLETRDAKNNGPTKKAQNQWVAERSCVSAELVDVGGQRFDVKQAGANGAAPGDLTQQVSEIASLAGLRNVTSTSEEDAAGKGPARWTRSVTGDVDVNTPYHVASIETKRTLSRPRPPFITSTLQQEASNRLGFGAQRTMRAAQHLYEGVELAGEGAIGLITYMRTDSTHLSNEAVESARNHIRATFGAKYLPEKPNRYASSNKSAQEAHEAIRPTSLEHPPERVKSALNPDQRKVYKIIWDRFIACQMTPAQWDATTVLIRGGRDAKTPLTFRATGRTLVFDGFYRVTGAPIASDEQTLPALSQDQALAPFSIEPAQRFTNPPPRYSEASLIKKLEAEGIGRPSTYAQIIHVIQDRKYVEQLERRFYATDLGEVVTDKLVEAFPEIMGIGYTRELERELDRIEEENHDWVKTLRDFYGPFKERLERAHESMVHAKAETQPAPDHLKCEECDAPLVYRFGKSGRFLSCSRYPECKYACPIDREGNPAPPETADVVCPNCSKPMIKRKGRFGSFFGCSDYPACAGILKADKQGRPLAPSTPPLMTDLPCPKCGEHLVLRRGVRGPWMSCSKYPKCRGRGAWAKLDDETKAGLEAALAAHEKEHPIPVIRNLKGEPLTDERGKPIERDDDSFVNPEVLVTAPIAADEEDVAA